MNINTTYDYFHILHHITNNVGIEIVLKDLEIKVKDYTKQDFCVILIGGTDFHYSQDYKMLVRAIREKLTKITNTNIILTTPTYICGKPLYNYRVETFNNLLNRDILSHKYGHLIDSNKDLTLDMFSYRTGKIKKYGVKNILHRIADFITSIRITNDDLEEHDEINNETEEDYPAVGKRPFRASEFFNNNEISILHQNRCCRCP